MLWIYRYLYPVCDKQLPEHFFSLEEANIHLDILSSTISEITDDLAALAQDNENAPKDFDGTNARLSNYFCASAIPTVDLDQEPLLALRMGKAQHDVRKWLAAFTNVPVTDETAMEHRLTRIFGFHTWLSIETCQNQDRTTLKRFKEQANYIVGVIEEYVNAYQDVKLLSRLPGITMGTGLVACICLIIAKFQNPCIRQRCLSLLRTIDPSGPFYSDNIVHYMQAVIETSESV